MDVEYHTFLNEFDSDIHDYRIIYYILKQYELRSDVMKYIEEWKEIEVGSNQYTIKKLNVLDVIRAVRLGNEFNEKDFLYILDKGSVSLTKEDLETMPFQVAMKLVEEIINWSVAK